MVVWEPCRACPGFVLINIFKSYKSEVLSWIIGQLRSGLRIVLMNSSNRMIRILMITNAFMRWSQCGSSHWKTGKNGWWRQSRWRRQELKVKWKLQTIGKVEKIRCSNYTASISLPQIIMVRNIWFTMLN